MDKSITKIFIILLLSLTLAGCGSNKICFDSECFTVEIAANNNSRQQGLMYRQNLDPQSGMLFIFPELDEHGIWMKNTFIPLDIIWLDEDKKIVFINKNTQPCDTERCSTIQPDKKALYVLEVNAGTAEKINLQIGNQGKF